MTAMNRDDAENYLTRKPEDEHLHVVIDQRMRLCQKTMAPDIEKAQRTAEAAHRRQDDHCKEDHDGERGCNTRLSRLDDSETGKVTIMWKERSKIIALGSFLLLAIIANLVVSLSKREPIDQAAMERAVVAAIQNIYKTGGGIK